LLCDVGEVAGLREVASKHDEESRWNSLGEAINWVYASFTRAQEHIQGKLDKNVRHPGWTRRILDELDSPDRKAYNVVVSGSKGKGSHAIFVAAMLQTMGLRVGLFTGPHHLHFLERLRIDGESISEDAFVGYLHRVREVTAVFSLADDEYLGPIGLLATVAALWFDEMQTDVNIYECGRGALFDDVNQISHRGTVLTPIFNEHSERLGPTLDDIIVHKLGAITAETAWVCSNRQVSGQVFEYLAEHSNISTFRLGHEFNYQTNSDYPGEIDIQSTTEMHSHRVVVPSSLCVWASNIAVSWRAAQCVLTDLSQARGRWDEGRCVDSEFVIDLHGLQLPGRVQVLQNSPLVIVDGTIHSASVHFVLQRLAQARREGYSGTVTAVLGLPDDKDICGMAEMLCSHVQRMILTKAHNPHLHFTEVTQQLLAKWFDEIETYDYVEEAWHQIRACAKPRDVVLLLGTQSFVGDVLRVFKMDTTSLWNGKEGALK